MPIIRKEWLENSSHQTPLRLTEEASAVIAPKTLRGGGSGPVMTSLPDVDGALAAAGIPIYELDEEIPGPDRTHPRLTLIAGDLTSVEVLRKLVEVAKRLHPERTAPNRFPKPVTVVGPGAEYSATHPYRSPEAQELRGNLWDLGMDLIEPPAGGSIDKPDVRRFLAERFKDHRRILEQHSKKMQPGQESAEDPIGHLSSREYQVFIMLVDGVRPTEIAARLELSPATVDTYRASLMRKLDIHDLAGLVKFAVRRNLVAK